MCHQQLIVNEMCYISNSEVVSVDTEVVCYPHVVVIEVVCYQ